MKLHELWVEIPLNGDSITWTISDSEYHVKGLPATVPGQVHLDLLTVRLNGVASLV